METGPMLRFLIHRRDGIARIAFGLALVGACAGLAAYESARTAEPGRIETRHAGAERCSAEGRGMAGIVCAGSRTAARRDNAPTFGPGRPSGIQFLSAPGD